MNTDICDEVLENIKQSLLRCQNNKKTYELIKPFRPFTISNAKKYKGNLFTYIMNYNISKYVGIIHLCGMIVEDVYGFIIRKNIFFDKLYIISFVSIPFSWILCKDECIISYIMKKVENKNYILGNNPENVNDISNLFTKEHYYFIFYNVNNLLRIFSVIIVNKRTTNINDVIMIPTCVLFLFYNYDITYKLNYRKLLYPYFQMILCFYFFTIFYKTIGV